MLEPAWRFRFRGKGGGFGLLTSTPLAVGGTVYVQDAKSSVFALERTSGRLRWARLYTAPNDGPNGAAVVGDRVVAATDTTVFALNRANGRRTVEPAPGRPGRAVRRHRACRRSRPRLRQHRGFRARRPGRDLCARPRARVGCAGSSTRSLSRGRPAQAGGGGAWNPVSVDAAGRVYAGISNPGPWGGSKARPNGGAYPGPALYTNSLVVLDGATGRLLWYDQVFPHDVRDYDFHVTPILARAGGRELVFGAGKGGRVVAWDRATRRRVWSRAVGTHLNDVGPLPRRPTRVCPGLFGGVLTPMALAAGRLFVPVVELCMTESGVHSASRPPAAAGGGPRRPRARSTPRRAAVVAARSRLRAVRHARRSRATSCSSRRSTAGSTPSRRERARRSGVIARRRASTGARPSRATCCFVPAGAPHRDFAKPRAAAPRVPRHPVQR